MSTLVIATEGCCKGHLCDNCKTCQSGRCCRKDNPDYKLPELGEWDGPIYGELGVLNDDGEKVECHCCGVYVSNLGNHIRVHDLTPDEYRSVFGLNYGQGLLGPALRHRYQEYPRERESMRDSKPVSTPEQRESGKLKPRRLQMKLHAVESHVGIQPSRHSDSVSHFLGVGAVRDRQRWNAEICYCGIRYRLGQYDTEESAARAYDAKAKELYGDKARLNFPEEVAV